MATVTSYTAARMKQIEDTAIVNGNVVGGNLMLTRKNSTQINAGSVIGPTGPQGPTAPGIIVCGSSTRPTGASLFTGLAIYEIDTKRFYIYDGTTWIYRGGVWACTSSTRPSAPFDGLSIWETDTDMVYVYNGTAWVYRGGTIVCTSTTRPVAFKGLEIYETDTDRKLIYNGVRWDPPWNQPWGFVGMAQRTTDYGPMGGDQPEVTIPGMIINYTAVANRRLKIVFDGNTFAQAGTNVISFCRICVDVTSLSTGNSWSNISGYGTSLHTEAIHTPIAGAHQYYLRAACIGFATCLLMGRPDTPMTLYIEDMGPAGAPV